jgi:hypothetical protein
MPSSPPSPDELLLRCHFVYEIKMLQETYRRCWEEVSDDAEDEKKILNNALIESFCVHARNLIEFFQDKKFRVTYANSQYLPFSQVSPNTMNAIYGRLCAQITHLVHSGTQNRTIDALQKINAKDRYEILGILRGEIIQFKGKLVPSYAQMAAAIPEPLHPFNIPVAQSPYATTTTTNFTSAGGYFPPPEKPE